MERPEAIPSGLFLFARDQPLRDLVRAGGSSQHVIASRPVAVGAGATLAPEWALRRVSALRAVSVPVSERARARGLHTVEALKRQVLQQRATWWQGQTYHCPLCDVDFGAAQLAAEHVVREQHPVLRMD